MKTRAELKQMAKEQIKGNIGILFVCSLIIAAISAVNAIPVVGLIASLIITPCLLLGLTNIYLGMTKGEPAEVGKLFGGFSNWKTAFLLYLQIMIFTALWSLLFVIPGIIKAYSYSQAFYILAENPEMTASEALNESKRITQGHKMELFILQLSFILWILLGSVTFGLAYIYVIPYMQATITNFYLEIKGDSVSAM